MDFLSLIRNELGIRLGVWRIRRIALHRHIGRVDRIREHAHRHAQCLLYLRGRGVQAIAGREWPVARGALFHLAPGRRHGFLKERERPPVCLALDFESGGGTGWPERAMVSAEAMSRIEARLHRMGRGAGEFGIAAGTLEIFEALAEALESRGRGGGPFSERVTRWIAGHPLDEQSPGGIAEGVGVGLDRLNRLLKLESSPSVGRMLAAARLERAGELLRAGEWEVGRVGAEVGFLDPNYFARWFRRQTGQSPSQWRRAQPPASRLAMRGNSSQWKGNTANQ